MRALGLSLRLGRKKGFSDFAVGPSLPNEPVTTPNECKDTEPKIDWLPLTTLHPDWQKRIEQQCYCGEYP